jgi:hypothetical protein
LQGQTVKGKKQRKKGNRVRRRVEGRKEGRPKEKNLAAHFERKLATETAW